MKKKDNDIFIFEAQELVFTEGEKADFLYIVMEGKVQIFTEEDGRLFPLSTINRKEIFGESGIFHGETRNHSAIALEKTKVQAIKREDILSQVAQCNKWVGGFMETIAERLSESENTVKRHKINDSRFWEDGSWTEEIAAKTRSIYFDGKSK